MSVHFPATSWQEQATFLWSDDDVFVLEQHSFYSASSLKQQFVGRHVLPLVNIILRSDDDVFVLEQHLFYSASSLKQQFVGRHVLPLVNLSRFRTNQSYPDSLMLHV